MFAISSSSFVIDPHSRLGVAEPFLIFAALANNTEAGGVLRMKV
jgi:hypothetical protein